MYLHLALAFSPHSRFHTRLPAARQRSGWLLACATFLIFAMWTSGANAAGYRAVDSNGIKAGVWYPSNTRTTVQRLGPFEADMATDAAIADGKFALVLFSHGVGGHYRNHYLTMQALADAGYIVIAPNHRADHWIDGAKRAQVLDDRYLALQKSLEWVQNDIDFIPHIDISKVHGVGYSLGGASIMLASGAGFASSLVDVHCDNKGHIDAEFCDGPGFIFKVIQFFKDSPQLRPTSDPFRNPALITGNTILIAPVSVGLDVTQGLSMSRLAIIAIEGDSMAKPRFHAKPLFDEAKKHVPTKLGIVPGHHYGFIAPFPKWLTDEEDIPVAKDPAGFNRPKYIKSINALIIDALAVN